MGKPRDDSLAAPSPPVMAQARQVKPLAPNGCIGEAQVSF